MANEITLDELPQVVGYLTISGANTQNCGDIATAAGCINRVFVFDMLIFVNSLSPTSFM